MNTIVSTSALGLALLVLGALLFWKKKNLKVVTWLWFFASLSLAGGIIATLRDVLRQAGDAGGPLFGVTANVILGIIGIALFVVMVMEAPLKKGKGRPKKSTPFLALAAPIVLGCVTGGTLASWVTALSGVVGRVGGPVATFFGA